MTEYDIIDISVKFNRKEVQHTWNEIISKEGLLDFLKTLTGYVESDTLCWCDLHIVHLEAKS